MANVTTIHLELPCGDSEYELDEDFESSSDEDSENENNIEYSDDEDYDEDSQDDSDDSDNDSNDDDAVWTDFTSGKVELAGFQWFVSGQFYDDQSLFCIRNTKIHCAPVGEKKNCIWNCEAVGKIVAFASKSDRHCSKICSHSYDFLHSISEPVDVQFCQLFPKNSNLIFEKDDKNFFKIDVQINVSSYKLIDLSDPNNPMIQFQGDAVHVDVEGEKLWLSKAYLGMHSPFFKTLFFSDFKEKRTGVYELKEIQLNQFLHCLSLLCGVHVAIDDNAIEYLMKLGDYFQFDVVISHCRHLLLQSAIPIEKKLKLVDRLGIHNMAEKLLLKMKSSSLKKIVNSGDVLEYSAVLNTQIMNRMKELLPK